MPGITSANVRTKSAYGSLRTGKIEFKCYNQRQLEILEMLYMRPGYSVLLEWGWTPYVNNFGQTTNTFPYCGGFYDDDATHEIIEKQIYDNKRISGGNYDALMGIVRNFEYKLRDDGGYDCQTELISRGEVLESLKMNKEGVWSENRKNESGEELEDGWENKTVLEIILDKIMSYGEYSDELNDNYFQGGLWDETRYRDKWRVVREELWKLFGKEFYGTIENDTDDEEQFGHDKGDGLEFKNGNSAKNLYPYIIVKDTMRVTGESDKGNNKDVRGSTFSSTNAKASYIRWDALTHLINRHCIPQTPKSEWSRSEDAIVDNPERDDPLFKIVNYNILQRDQQPATSMNRDENAFNFLNSFGFGNKKPPAGGIVSPLYFAEVVSPLADMLPKLRNKKIDWSVLDMSLDPSVCLLPQQIYKIGSWQHKGKHKVGSWGKKAVKYMFDWDDINVDKDSGDWFGYELPNDIKDRRTDWIYLNVEHLKGICRNLGYSGDGRENPDFGLYDFLKKVWDNVNIATGNAHDFQIRQPSENSTWIQIVDMAMTDDPELDLDNIYELKIQSTDSVVRDITYNTSIPNELSSTIAIAAQAPSSVDSLEAVTWNALSKNVINRFTDLTPEDKKKEPTKLQRAKWRDAVDADLDIIYECAHLETEENGGEAQSGTLVQWRTDMLEGFGQAVNDEGAAENAELIDENKGALKAMQAATERCNLKWGYTRELPGIGWVYYGQPNPNPAQPRSAIIPLKFNAKMDGISGLVIGNVFKLPKDRLPKGYKEDEIHFIVMGEEQDMSDNDWTTTITGHLILLSDDDGNGFEAWDANNYDESKGEMYTDGSNIDQEQAVIDPDMNEVREGDDVYLKIQDSYTNFRASSYVNNERFLAGDIWNDNSIGMFDMNTKDGSEALHLGEVLEFSETPRFPTTFGSNLKADFFDGRINTPDSFFDLGKKEDKSDSGQDDDGTIMDSVNKERELMLADDSGFAGEGGRQVKVENQQVDYRSEGGAVAYSTTEKVYKVKATQKMVDSGEFPSGTKAGDWVAIDPESANLISVWYKIELSQDALDHFNIGWVMNLDGMETEDGKKVSWSDYGSMLNIPTEDAYQKMLNDNLVHSWRIDKNGADYWDRPFETTWIPRMVAYSVKNWFDYVVMWAEGIKDDDDMRTVASGVVIWKGPARCFLQGGRRDRKGTIASVTVQITDEYNRGRDGTAIGWMRIDTLQSKAEWSPDGLQSTFENAQPRIKGTPQKRENNIVETNKKKDY